ncbi:MAG: glycosyltransferase family 9 protein [Syntrophobacterales bacterium]|nr:glycosyltransferase family 9 protein [Syntrophobacterales bacterium]
MTPERVLVLQLARLGDLVQTWPLVRRLKAAWPGARLELVCEAGLVSLSDLGPPLAGVHGLEVGRLAALARHNPAAAARRLRERLQDLRRLRPEVLVNLNLSRLSLLLTHGVGAPALGYQPLAGGREFGRPPWLAYVFALAHARRLNRLHLSDVFRHLAPTAPEEPFPGATPGRAGGELRVGLVPGTRHPKRTWPPAAFARLICLVADRTAARFLLFGTGAERPLGEAIFRELPGRLRDRVLNRLGATGLAELAGELQGLSLLISGDTGTLHLAAALGVPCLGLYFGPAQAAETGPYGEGHLVLQAEPPCHPCREGDPCADPVCLRLLTPERVARVAAARLRGEPLHQEPLPPEVRLYDTGRDLLGACLNPLGGRPPELPDLVGLAYRHLGARLLGLANGGPQRLELPLPLRSSLTRLAQAARRHNPALSLPEAELLRPLKAFRAEAARQGLLQGRPQLWEELTAALESDFAHHLEVLAG